MELEGENQATPGPNSASFLHRCRKKMLGGSYRLTQSYFLMPSFLQEVLYMGKACMSYLTGSPVNGLATVQQYIRSSWCREGGKDE